MTNESAAGTSALGRAAEWQPDVLGDEYEFHTLELGPDPDGEGDIVATLVRHLPDATATADAVLYVHGFTDY
ncbi:MAG: alpha/beta hydrolase, partial [Nocardia sp.]|nr:alpha/beta hydrolase [Nocardia sp.]